MAVATPAAGAAKQTVRQKRERDQELLVWPDLVFVEFICSVLFTITFVVLSTVVNAPLLNKANDNITPNPSKAPWYLMNLQELLLHMDKGLAGVIVPTIALIALMMMPYIDRAREGQGSWFSTLNSVRITMVTLAYSSVTLIWLILWDAGKHVEVYKRFTNAFGITDGNVRWPGDRVDGEPIYHMPFGWMQPFWDFIFLRNRLALRDEWQWRIPVPFQPGSGSHDGSLNWPQDFQNIPLPLNGTWIFQWGDPGWMPGWLRAMYPYDGHLDLPAILAEYIVPIATIALLPTILIVILFKIGWAHTVRDVMIVLFTGFILCWVGLTIIGAAFRGRGQELVPFWKVPNLEGDPSITREAPPADVAFALVDMRSGRHA